MDGRNGIRISGELNQRIPDDILSPTEPQPVHQPSSRCGICWPNPPRES